MCFTFTFAFLLHQSGLYPLLPVETLSLAFNVPSKILLWNG